MLALHSGQDIRRFGKACATEEGKCIVSHLVLIKSFGNRLSQRENSQARHHYLPARMPIILNGLSIFSSFGGRLSFKNSTKQDYTPFTSPMMSIGGSSRLLTGMEPLMGHTSPRLSLPTRTLEMPTSPQISTA